MTLLLVLHATPYPALDGLIAGEFAGQRGARVVTAVTGGAGHARFDAVQHVLAHGELAPNGLVWAERATGQPVPPPVDRGAVVREPGTVVVPLNPLLPAHEEARARIRATAARAGREVETYEVHETGGLFELRPEGQATPVGRWRRDMFGRPMPAGAPFPVPAGPVRRVMIVADEGRMREVYPAVLAALGDAAEAHGAGLDLVVVDPRDEPDASDVRAWERRLADMDGLLLPGGSDMEQVAGQIAAARAAIRHDLPTVGLCLGLQTMTTAVAQEICGLNDVNLAEADPEAQTKSFVRLHDAYGRPMHRLGLQTCRLTPGSRLAALAGADTLAVPSNHRFVLDPALEARLAGGGLLVCGRQAENDHADAIDVPALRFFLAMQGHPELASRRGAPHPLLAGFVAALAR